MVGGVPTASRRSAPAAPPRRQPGCSCTPRNKRQPRASSRALRRPSSASGTVNLTMTLLRSSAYRRSSMKPGTRPLTASLRVPADDVDERVRRAFELGRGSDSLMTRMRRLSTIALNAMASCPISSLAPPRSGVDRDPRWPPPPPPASPASIRLENARPMSNAARQPSSRPPPPMAPRRRDGRRGSPRRSASCRARARACHGAPPARRRGHDTQSAATDFEPRLRGRRRRHQGTIAVAEEELAVGAEQRQVQNLARVVAASKTSRAVSLSAKATPSGAAGRRSRPSRRRPLQQRDLARREVGRQKRHQPDHDRGYEARRA